MPKNAIKLTSGVQLGNEFASISRNLGIQVSSLRRLADKIYHLVDVAGSDYADLEQYLGLEVGKGQAVYTAINAAIAEIDGSTNLKNIIEFPVQL